MKADTTIGQRLREFRVVSAEIGGMFPLVGREPELADLRAAFADTAQLGQPVVRVLAGLGGVGKTSIARAYAQAHQLQYGLVWWVQAQHRDQIASQYRTLLEMLVPEEAARVSDPVTAVNTVLANRVGRWLLVLDNVPDSDAARGLIPASGAGHVMITSQARSWRREEMIAVGCLTVDQGASLLMDLSGDLNVSSARTLAEELGGLPLALAQAGSYVGSVPGTSLTDYLRLYEQRRVEMYEQGQAPNYEKTVYTTWDIAVNALSESARALLKVLCWCAPEVIPLRLLLAGPPEDSLPDATAGLIEPLLRDALARNKATSALHTTSLTTPAGPPGAVSIHRLVQAVTRDHIKSPEPWILTAVALIEQALPEPTPNLVTLQQWAYLQTHLRSVLRHLPPDHIDTLSARGHLAYWTGHSGDDAQARDMYADLIPNSIRVLGPDDRDTLIARSHLAYWTGETGDAAQARDMYADLIPNSIRALGPDDRDTLNARSDLARWTGETGDAAQARDMGADLIPDILRALGPDNRSTLNARSNLAYWTGHSGDAAQARNMYADLIPDMLRVLGPDDRDTLIARNHLAYWTGEARTR